MYINNWQKKIRGHPENDIFLQFSQNIDAFRQNNSQCFKNSPNSIKQNPLEIFFFTVYQNHTLALNSFVSVSVIYENYSQTS